mmetsp:Transcript_21897/g.43458  ORF Transcript_21897/g.43458 Transcript_21897/m.43458 type:complete len:225 (+) Transcript_21897:2658-3332(+)
MTLRSVKWPRLALSSMYRLKNLPQNRLKCSAMPMKKPRQKRSKWQRSRTPTSRYLLPPPKRFRMSSTRRLLRWHRNMWPFLNRFALSVKPWPSLWKKREPRWLLNTKHVFKLQESKRKNLPVPSRKPWLSLVPKRRLKPNRWQRRPVHWLKNEPKLLLTQAPRWKLRFSNFRKMLWKWLTNAPVLCKRAVLIPKLKPETSSNSNLKWRRNLALHTPSLSKAPLS